MKMLGKALINSVSIFLYIILVSSFVGFLGHSFPGEDKTVLVVTGVIIIGR